MGGDDIHRSVRPKRWKQWVINLLSDPLTIAFVATAAGEVWLYYDAIGPALWGHLLALFVCLGAPLVADTHDSALRVFTFVPVFRLVNFGMPVFVPITVYWLPVVYAAVLPGLYLVATDDRTPDPRWNIRLTIPLLLPSTFLGGVVGVLEYRVLEPVALIPVLSVKNLVVMGVVMVCFVGLAEELLFRGLLEPALADRVGRLPSVVLTNLLFGTMHTAYASWAIVGFAAAVGVLLSVVYDTTDSLLLTISVHGTANVFLFGIAPLS
jgi:hypothetical protein